MVATSAATARRPPAAGAAIEPMAPLALDDEDYLSELSLQESRPTYGVGDTARGVTAGRVGRAAGRGDSDGGAGGAGSACLAERGGSVGAGAGGARRAGRGHAARAGNVELARLSEDAGGRVGRDKVDLETRAGRPGARRVGDGGGDLSVGGSAVL